MEEIKFKVVKKGIMGETETSEVTFTDDNEISSENSESGGLINKSITENGTYEASSDDATGYDKVVVDVPSEEPTLIEKNITANGQYLASADNADGYSEVDVAVPGPTLIEKNITQNGTYDASDDQADGYSQVVVDVQDPTPVEKYILTVYDYDGTVLYEGKHYANDVITLPTQPVHSRLVFDEWVCPTQLITDGTVTMPEHDLDVGPYYHTASGYVEIDILVPSDNFNFKFNSYSGEIDWGDGTVETYTSSGHTYATAGKYTILLKKYYGLTNQTIESLFAGSQPSSAQTLIEVRSSDNIMRFGSGCFNGCLNLRAITGTFKYVYFNKTFYNCYSLQALIINYRSTGNPMLGGSQELYNCYSLKCIIGRHITNQASRFVNAGNNSYSLKVLVDPCIGSTNYSVCSESFSYSYQLRTVVLNMHDTPSNCFGYSLNLKKFICSPGLNNLSNKVIYSNTYYGDYIFPTNLTCKILSGYQNYKSHIRFENDEVYLITSENNSSGYTFYNNENIKKVTFGIGCASICLNYNFYSCHSLTSVIFEDDDMEIRDTRYAFNNANALKEITFPKHVTSIGQYCFYNCYNLEKVKSSVDLTSINSSAFYNNFNLKILDFSRCSQVPSLASAMFQKYCLKHIIVPDALYEEWITTTNWSVYASWIIKASDYQGD